jgi:hypothetical protein
MSVTRNTTNFNVRFVELDAQKVEVKVVHEQAISVDHWPDEDPWISAKDLANRLVGGRFLHYEPTVGVDADLRLQIVE